MPHRIMQAVWHAQQALQLITEIAAELQQEKELRNSGYLGPSNQPYTNHTYGMNYPFGYEPMRPDYNQQAMPTGVSYGMIQGTPYVQPTTWQQTMQTPAPQAWQQPSPAGMNVPVTWEDTQMSETADNNTVLKDEPARGAIPKKTVSSKEKSVRKNVAEDKQQGH